MMLESSSSIKVKEVDGDRLSESSTKPLYFSKVTIEGDNSSCPLSDSFYKAILDQALTNPLQNVNTSLMTFQDIKRNFLYTGLYQDVNVSFEEDTAGASIEYLRGKVPREYGIELPIPTHAKVLLKPSVVYNNSAATTTLEDDSAAVDFCRTWMNQLGFADSAMLYWGIKYDPVKASWGNMSSKGDFSIPLTRNPSIRGLLNFEYSELTGLNDFQALGEKKFEYITSMGFQKSWLLNNCKSIPTFYSGLSFTGRNNGMETNKEQNSVFSLKTGIISQFCHDSRKFYGTLPVSGHLVKVNNEYVVSQSEMASVDESIDASFEKFQMSYEHHSSFFKNVLTRSFDFQFGGILPMGENAKVDSQDKFYLGGSCSMKGFQSKGVSAGGNNFYYKFGLRSSHKLFHNPLNSPLRFQLFLDFGNAFSSIKNAFDSYAASTGASLVYKTPQGDMDLTYAYPLTSRSQDITKPGFSFGLTFSYF